MIYPYKGVEPKMGEGCFIAPSADIAGKVEIGDRANIWFNASIRGDLDWVRIGKRSSIQDNSVLHNDKGLPVEIGDDVIVGHRAVVHGAMIGDGSLIGMGAVVLSGAKIGKNCIIGAGSVVTERTVIPDGSIALGTPAKVVKPAGEEHIKRIRMTVEEYLELSADYQKEDIV
jgi:carbonic anhydrase/acetyltransferase-like protein (isoleucine patch superfamily)